MTGIFMWQNLEKNVVKLGLCTKTNEAENVKKLPAQVIDHLFIYDKLFFVLLTMLLLLW